MAAPKVSVCIDVYNYGAYLPEAIRSVLDQTLTDLELIIGDDCSTDNSFEIAQEYAARDPRIRVQRNPRNLGMIGNRNACLRAAAGEYVKILHADDFLSTPDALARMVALLEERPAAALVACGMRYVDERSQALDQDAHFEDGTLLAGTTVITRCLAEQRNLVGSPSAVLFRRSLAGRGFDEAFFHSADLEMWFHLLEQGCFAYLREPLVAYRKHPGQQTVKDAATMSPAREYVALLDRYLGEKYVHLKREMKQYLRLDAVKRLVGRSRRLGHAAEGAAAVRRYGAARYYAGQPIAALARPAIRLWRSAERRLPPAAPSAELPPTGINLAGFMEGFYGIGESSRAFRSAVEASGLPHAFVIIRRKRDPRRGHYPRANPYRFNLMTFSFDYARRFSRDMGPRFFRDRYSIGLWYWELERFPAAFHSDFDYYQEIWTVAEFSRTAFEAVSPIPIHKITYPLRVEPPDPKIGRSHFGLDDRSFVALFAFDYNSEIARKNPVAIVESFRRAFAKDENAVLVLKTINAARRPEDHATVMRAAEGINLVHLDRSLPGPEMSALYAACDTYISLHRSEGLGLGMAQCMWLGKPVIATGYSGNLEYMNPENSLLTPYTLREIDQQYGPYYRGACWAEADRDAAAAHLRWVYENREAAAALGRKAAEDVRQVLDPARCAREIRERIEHLSGGSG